MSAAIPMRRELRLEASPIDLWPLISNTNQFNRALGLPVVIPEAAGDSLSKPMSARLFGLKLSWKEFPFEWVEGRFYRAMREFDEGPFERFEGGMELSCDGRGCAIKFDSNFTPRNALGAFLIKYVTGRKAVKDTEALLRRIDESLKAANYEPFPAHRVKTPGREASFKLKCDALRQAPIDRRIGERLTAFLSEAYDDQLSRMRPYELADTWGVERCSTLKVFLHAVKAGLLEMNWDVLCPNCGGPGKTIET